jgi:hypothetical protein
MKKLLIVLLTLTSLSIVSHKELSAMKTLQVESLPKVFVNNQEITLDSQGNGSIELLKNENFIVYLTIDPHYISLYKYDRKIVHPFGITGKELNIFDPNISAIYITTNIDSQDPFNSKIDVKTIKK